MPNPQLKWEQKLEYNVGFDLRTSRLNLSFDYFSADSKNMLTDLSIQTSTGFSSVKDNIGLVRNSGLEAKLNYLLVQRPSACTGTSYTRKTRSSGFRKACVTITRPLKRTPKSPVRRPRSSFTRTAAP